MSSTLWSLLFKIEGDSASMRRELDAADRRLATFERGIDRSSRNVGRGLSQMARGTGQVASGLDRLATRAVLFAAAGLGAVVTAAVQFEDAFAGVRKTVDATDAELAQLRGELRQMAREMPLSHGELAAVAEQAGALGIALPNIAEFTRVAALLGVTTNVSADQAATSLGVLSNILGLTQADYERFGSTLVDLGNKGASTESQILGIAERAGAGAKLINMNAAATLGWSAAVANLGIEVEAGGSSLQRFFQMSLEHVARGGDELALYAETAGLAKDEFAELFGRDSSEALRRFVGGLGKLEQAERLAVLEALGFNDIRISRALLGLSGNVDNLTDSLSIANEAWAENSALGVEAEKRFETTASQLQILRNNILDAAITIGDNLLPVLNELVKSGVAWLLEHEAEIDQFGQDLAAGIRNVVDELKSADFTVLVEGMKTAGDIARGAFDLFRRLPPEVQQLAIAALIANKVTGGAVFDIAKGLANIFGGALRTIHAAHVTVIGAGVGGVPGVGGGGGFAGGLRAGLAAAGAVGLGAALVGETWANNPANAGAQAAAGNAIPAGTVNLLNSSAFGRFYAANLDVQDFWNMLNDGNRTQKAAQVGIEKAVASIGTRASETSLADGLNRLTELRAETEEGFAAVGEGGKIVADNVAKVEEALPDTAVMEGAAATTTAQLPLINGIVDGVGSVFKAAVGIGTKVDAMHGTLIAKNFSPTVILGGGAGAQLRGHTPVHLDHGTWDLPASGLAMLHEGEMVIPRFDARAFRDVAGSGGAGDHYEVNINAPTRPMTAVDIGLQLRRVQRLRQHATPRAG